MAMGLILGGLIALMFAVTMVKLSRPQNVDIKAPNYVAPTGASE